MALAGGVEEQDAGLGVARIAGRLQFDVLRYVPSGATCTEKNPSSSSFVRFRRDIYDNFSTADGISRIEKKTVENKDERKRRRRSGDSRRRRIDSSKGQAEKRKRNSTESPPRSIKRGNASDRAVPRIEGVIFFDPKTNKEPWPFDLPTKLEGQVGGPVSRNGRKQKRGNQ